MAKSEEQEVYIKVLEEKIVEMMQKTVKILCEESLFCDARTDTDQKLRTYLMYFMFKIVYFFVLYPCYLTDSFSFS